MRKFLPSDVHEPDITRRFVYRSKQLSAAIDRQPGMT